MRGWSDLDVAQASSPASYAGVSPAGVPYTEMICTGTVHELAAGDGHATRLRIDSRNALK